MSGVAGRGDGIDRELLAAMCRTYADVLGRQRTAASPLARWTKATSRSQEFVWLGGAFDRDQLMLGARESLVFSPGDPLFEAVHKMYGTARLNPYEREVLYGYPYVIGRSRSTTTRGPLLTLAVEIEAVRNHFEVRAADEVVRFNSLPFRSETDTDAHEQALGRVLEATPAFPLTVESLGQFLDVLCRELPSLQRKAALDGSLVAPPEEPRGQETIRLVDAAALFVAPKTSYFLRSDLDEIAGAEGGEPGALRALVEGAGGDEEQVDITEADVDRARVYFPFPSNRAQRRVAVLLDDPTTHVVRVEGPPGTGKSLTIANLACHLAATGKAVLVTSQKDKALEVVDDKLRELDLAELPMTLLRHDRESKRELLSRLDQVEKRRGKDEVDAEFSSLGQTYGDEAHGQVRDAEAFGSAMRWESAIEEAHRATNVPQRLRRLSKRWHARSVVRHAHRQAPEATDEIAARVSERRDELLRLSLEVVQVGLERAVSGAKRTERQVVRELQQVLKRDQKAHRNFSLFDRLKQDLDQAQKLLRILPVWIMSPDDVARLFPCSEDLFDVVIVDEASQVDLPSIAPIAYRAKKVVVFGDTKQMQSQRFAFMSRNVAVEAWQRFGMDRLDPTRKLHPVEQSLLNLATIHAQEENLLDEHFRSLPPIIDFSNGRWYDGRLRIMTDAAYKQFGSPDQPIIELHHVEDGVISNGGQENEVEATALVDLLGRIVVDPDYAGAEIGVLCLFEEQVALVNDLVAEAIDVAEWDEHKLVVVNPDGFQGDERDVILYSLSWDNNLMPQAALSARQADSSHIQGMLNVAFTRARDEIHVFHSAPIGTFGMAGGKGGALSDWMAHCAAVQADGGQRRSARHGRVDSEFEAEVAEALRARGVTVFHQYPACGFSIDLVCDLEGSRVAVECDGELYHEDEHGQLRVEDVERQAILERAGWYVLRIPYRKWLKRPGEQVERVLEALTDEDSGSSDDNEDAAQPSGRRQRAPTQAVTREQEAVVQALRNDLRLEDDLLRFARARLGHKRLGPNIRSDLLLAVRSLNHLGLLVVEDGEYFLTPLGREAELRVTQPVRTAPRSRPVRSQTRNSFPPSSGRRRRY
jgi:very-short-patch-repair endonuclease/KaiC/GvpD/RAD55 family RecA-like ATPase